MSARTAPSLRDDGHRRLARRKAVALLRERLGNDLARAPLQRRVDRRLDDDLGALTGIDRRQVLHDEVDGVSGAGPLGEAERAREADLLAACRVFLARP